MVDVEISFSGITQTEKLHQTNPSDQAQVPSATKLEVSHNNGSVYDQPDIVA